MSLTTAILMNPLVMGIILKNAMECIRELLGQVDESGKLKDQKWLEPASIILSLLATAASLAASGHLADLDLNVLKDFILTYLGTRAAGTATLKALTRNKVKPLLGQMVCKIKTLLK